MNKKFVYFFILGNNPSLSVAEILSLINTDFFINGINIREISEKFIQIRELSNEVLILETKEKLDCQKLQERLGGTIKIGTILTQINADLTQINVDLFLKELPKNGKIYFGFSLYGFGDKFKIKSLRSEVKNMALKMKKELKQKNVYSRWVESKKSALSSVIVQKNKLLTQGAEFCFIAWTDTGKNTDKHGNPQYPVLSQRRSVYVGKTLSCQQFEEYEFYDFARPKRKIEEGMIPPKLAKIMINLSQAPQDGIILDPFCGSGTIIQEAILMGYKNLIGMDLSEEAIKNSWQNIRWFFENSKFKIQNSKLKLKIQKCDVRNLSQKILPKSVDAIITESYLGPVKKSEIKSQKLRIISELSELYIKAFREFGKVLKENRRIVIVFPILKLDGELNFLSILDELKKIGWHVINPIPDELRKNSAIKITNRDSVIYSRPDQTVLREILIFKMRS